MTDALTVFFNIGSSLFNCIFGLSVSAGVSLGMIFVAIYVFAILLKYLLAVPKVNLRGLKHEKDTSSSSSSNPSN